MIDSPMVGNLELHRLTISNLHELEAVLGLKPMVPTTKKADMLEHTYSGLAKLSDCYKLSKKAIEESSFYKNRFAPMSDDEWALVKMELGNVNLFRRNGIVSICEGIVQPLSSDEEDEEEASSSTQALRGIFSSGTGTETLVEPLTIEPEAEEEASSSTQVLSGIFSSGTGAETLVEPLTMQQEYEEEYHVSTLA